MRFLTRKLVQRFAEVGSQRQVSDPLVVAHFFSPTGYADWYATEYDPKTRRYFGYVKIGTGEWTHFSLAFFETPCPPFGLVVKCDRHWVERPASQVIAGGTHLGHGK